MDSRISVELLLSWPLLGGGEAAASNSFIRTFSNATTATLVNNSSMLSPAEEGREGRGEREGGGERGNEGRSGGGKETSSSFRNQNLSCYSRAQNSDTPSQGSHIPSLELVDQNSALYLSAKPSAFFTISL
jgi:hypothetical protein